MMNEVVKIRMEQLGGVGIPTLGGSVGGSNLDFHEIFLPARQARVTSTLMTPLRTLRVRTLRWKHMQNRQIKSQVLL